MLNNLKLCIFSLIFSCLFSFNLEAHQLSRSFSKWEIKDNEVKVTFTVPSLQVTLLPAIEGPSSNLEELLTRHLSKHLKVFVADEECKKDQKIKSTYGENDYVRSEIIFNCEQSGDSLLIQNNSFFPVSIGHVHFARVKIEEMEWQESIFTSSRQTASFSLETGKSDRSKKDIFVDYVFLGFEHILEGYDHLAFLLAILLITFGFRRILLSITGFTLGHSITLALASLGIVQPSGPAVEALIGFTILLVAYEALTLEEKNKSLYAFFLSLLIIILAGFSLTLGGTINLLTWIGLIIFTLSYSILLENRDQAERANPIITIIFGLIHGFGFAGVLTELGLPKDGIVIGLLGFNIGVELGQILVVFLAVFGLFVLGKTYLSRYRHIAYDLTGMFLIALGVYWFVGRALGI